MKNSLINLGQETRSNIEYVGKTVEDVAYVVASSKIIPFDTFIKAADNINYDYSACLNHTPIIDTKLFIVFKGEKEWLQRERVIVGESWTLATHPSYCTHDYNGNIDEGDLLYLGEYDIKRGRVELGA